MIEILKELFALNFRLMIKEESGQARITVLDRNTNMTSSELLDTSSTDQQLFDTINKVKDKLKTKL